jgi:hypothetical protein
MPSASSQGDTSFKSRSMFVAIVRDLDLTDEVQLTDPQADGAQEP